MKKQESARQSVVTGANREVGLHQEKVKRRQQQHDAERLRHQQEHDAWLLEMKSDGEVLDTAVDDKKVRSLRAGAH